MTVDRSEGIPGDDFIPRLRLLGEIFVSALERIRAAQSLGESEAKYRIVADFTYDWEYWENADGATLFLDEIGELPLELQAKLLRVLERGEFERLGSSNTLKTDVRIIAASNRDLEGEVEKGTFRRDLWYRLNVFSIILPCPKNGRQPPSINIFNKGEMT